MPLSCAFAFLVCFIISALIKAANRKNLYDFSVFCFGKIFAGIISVFLSAVIILQLSSLICRFLNLMHVYFFHDAKITAVAFYFMLVPVVFAFFGFETIGRTAKILGIIALLIQLLLFINSYSGYDGYKLYPIFGDGIGSMSYFAFRSLSLFFPMLLMCLTSAKGQNGMKSTQKIMLISAIIAALICAVVQLLLALSGSYN